MGVEIFCFVVNRSLLFATTGDERKPANLENCNVDYVVTLSQVFVAPERIGPRMDTDAHGLESDSE
jgi:hypothetical protein